jgi:hypothetical protein
MVRGAYMNEERLIAQEKGTESPVWESIDQTHANYDNNMTLLI